MSKSAVYILPAFLASKEKLKDRFLFVGKVSDNQDPSSFVFYIIEILTPWFPSAKIEKVISEILTKRFKGQNFDLNEFEQTLREINDSLIIIAQEGENDWIGNLNALIGLARNDQIHISLTGNINGYLIRNNKISSITDGLIQENEGSAEKSFVNITSGKLIPEDRVIIANVALYDFLSIDRLRKIVSELPAKTAIFEIHRGLRRIKAMEAGAIVMEASDINPDPRQKELPEFLYLDQNTKTWLEKSIEKTTPYAKKAYSQILSALKTGLKKSKDQAIVTKNSWNRKYGPKTKEFLIKAKDSTKKQFFKDGSTVSPLVKFRTNNIRVRAYNKKESRLLRYLSIAISKIGLIFKKENRRYLYLFLVALLVFSGYLKIRANNAKRVDLNVENKSIASLDEAENLLKTATEEIGLKRGDSGKEKLLTALDIATSAEQFASTHDRAVIIKRNIQDKIDEVIGATRFRDLKPIYAINGKIASTVLAGSKIYSFNKDGKIYATDTRDTEPVLIASIGEDGAKITDLSYTDSLDAIFISLNNQKIISLDVTRDTVGKVEVSGDASKNFESSVAIGAYASNIYLLDSSAGEVWKHSKTDTGFTVGSDYLNTKNVSLKNGIDLTIDGNIYVLNNNATVSKFTRGSFDQDFKIQAIPSPYEKISEPKSIFTDQDTNYIYVFDKSQNRIVRFDKTGTYSTQYIFEGITIDQFLVNPRVQKVWVISGSSVYEVSI